jgi:hypothetical protein
VLNRLRNNFGLKLLSLTLAVAAWAYFHLAAAPGTVARFDQNLSVPIDITGARPGYQVTTAEKSVSIVVEVPRNGQTFRTDQFRAVVDAGDLVDPGFHNVPVHIVPSDIAIRSLSPASVIVAVDRVGLRTASVGLDYLGDAHGVVVDSASLYPPTTTIRGVAASLAQVASMRVAIPIPHKPQDIDEMIAPVPTDADGREVPGIQVSPNLVRVHVKFVSATGTTHAPAAAPGR